MPRTLRSAAASADRRKCAPGRAGPDAKELHRLPEPLRRYIVSLLIRTHRLRGVPGMQLEAPGRARDLVDRHAQKRHLIGERPGLHTCDPVVVRVTVATSRVREQPRRARRSRPSSRACSPLARHIGDLQTLVPALAVAALVECAQERFTAAVALVEEVEAATRTTR